MRCASLPNPTARLLPPGRLFHGTRSEKAGEAILRQGYVVARKHRGPRSITTPVEGRVYVTRDVPTAMGYVLWSTAAFGDPGSHPDTSSGRYGYLFEVELDADADVNLDEDELGRRAANGEPIWLYRLAKKLAKGVAYVNDPDALLFDAVDDGEGEAEIQLGHLLLRHLDDDQMRKLFREGERFAVEGRARVVRAWRVDKLLHGEMVYEEAELLAMLEEVAVEPPRRRRYFP